MSYISDMVKRPPKGQPPVKPKPVSNNGPSIIPEHELFTKEEWTIIHEALCFIRKKPETQEAFIKFMNRNIRKDPSAVKTFLDGCSYEGHYLIGMVFSKIQELSEDDE